MMCDYWRAVDAANDLRRFDEFEEYMSLFYLFGCLDKDGRVEYHTVSTEEFKDFKRRVVANPEYIAFDYDILSIHENVRYQQENKLAASLKKEWEARQA